MEKKPPKSVSLAVVCTNRWTWKGSRSAQVMQAPVAGGGVGTVQAYGCSWGCFGLTVSFTSVRPLPAIQVVQGPAASGLVDLRGQVLGGGSNGQH